MNKTAFNVLTASYLDLALLFLFTVLVTAILSLGTHVAAEEVYCEKDETTLISSWPEIQCVERKNANAN